MSDWKTEQARYKAKKREIVEQRPVGGVSKKKQPPKLWKVWGPTWRGLKGLNGGKKEMVMHRAANKELCETWLEKKRRSYYTSRTDTAQQQDEAKRRHEEFISKYRIEGPDHG